MIYPRGYHYLPFILVPKVGEVEEGPRGNGEYDRPGLDVDV